MKINVFADTICGWCFIGHKNLNKALKNFPNIKFDIRHIPFQLNPDMPAEGILRDKYLEIKFGGKDYAAPMYENMKLKAKETGINLNLDKIKKTPNTVLSHLLIILSEQFNLQNEVKEKIYQSYFIDGLDIGDIDVLVDIAKENNIAENIFKEFINEKNIQNVTSKILVAKEKNISGVPFFEIGKDFISGAQSSIQLENTIKSNLN